MSGGDLLFNGFKTAWDLLEVAGHRLDTEPKHPADEAMEKAEDVSKIAELGAEAAGAETIKKILGPVGAFFGAYNLANGVSELDKAKTTDEGNKGWGDIVGGVGGIIGGLPGVGTAVGLGLSMAPKIAAGMNTAAKATELYGRDKDGKAKGVDDDAAEAGMATHDNGFHTDANGWTTPNEEAGPTAGGIARTIGQSALDVLTFQARMAATLGGKIVGAPIFNTIDSGMDEDARMRGLLDAQAQYVGAQGGDPAQIAKAKARMEYMEDLGKTPMQRALDQAASAVSSAGAPQEAATDAAARDE
jgi:hypothetical protein